MELEIEPLQRCIVAHGFHPLTEHEIYVIRQAFLRERNELKDMGTAAVNFGPMFGMDRLIQAMVDAFFMVRNVSRRW